MSEQMIASFYFIAGSLILILNTINYYFNSKLSNSMFIFYSIIFMFSIIACLNLVIFLQSQRDPNVFSIFSLLAIYVIILIIIVGLIQSNNKIIYSNLCYYSLVITCIINFLLFFEVSTQSGSDRDYTRFHFTSFTYRITLIFIAIMAFMLYPLIIETYYYHTDGFKNIYLV